MSLSIDRFFRDGFVYVTMGWDGCDAMDAMDTRDGMGVHCCYFFLTAGISKSNISLIIWGRSVE